MAVAYTRKTTAKVRAADVSNPRDCKRKRLRQGTAGEPDEPPGELPPVTETPVWPLAFLA